MKHYDSIVVGGGPGGSTAGTFLAQAGKRVLILEREQFPRFHIGESLIPYGNDVLRDLGAWPKLEAAGFMRKPGAEFTLGNAKGSLRFWFGRNLPKAYAETFQVERAKFDSLLLENARENGCEIASQAKAESFSDEGDKIRLTYRQGGEAFEATADYLIDASGRDTFLGKQLNLLKSDLGLPKKFAVFAHFHHVLRYEGRAEGLISIVRLKDAWCWIIPLDKEKTSVGLVQTLDTFKGRGLSPEECFEHVMKENKELRYRIGKAERIGPYYTTGDYTYRFYRAAGPRWLLVGDAAGFIDPIFSSGVMLALRSGRLAAENILKASATKRPLTEAEQDRHTKRIRHMTGVFHEMIRMFYDNRAYEVFMNPAPFLNLPAAVNNLVGGNTDLGFSLKWRVRLFYLFCRLQKKFRISPALDFTEETRRQAVVSGES